MNAQSTQRALAGLRRLSHVAPEPARCELCSLGLLEHHAHLFDPKERVALCSCRACALLFPADLSENAAPRYLQITPRIERLVDAQLAERVWNMLDLPVRLVFLCPSATHTQLFALYPNPQGVTEATFPHSAWSVLTRTEPLLGSIREDVQALILDDRPGRGTCHAVSIDVCHRLVGLLRTTTTARPRAWQKLELALLNLKAEGHD